MNKVLIADDEPMVRKELILLINWQEGNTTVALQYVEQLLAIQRSSQLSEADIRDVVLFLKQVQKVYDQS
ncbi:hypothetical protein Back11_47980 [Paenibacillus baekrokdamisoli]|uniref:Uncharacterized protein n=1 Tax=Paenibacillus baekrokdamisoli TaxID=1712516 RepID=A0A3G9JEQ7_9BACL|nr:hypothetical protein [Paenibacillus baekrokdamisoli]MBB3068619.1 DNA-binding NarL/FixJ family response regulator [Paenibacillus baekrokdamisoli]BBH23453.1 hypothetical protein Back11_47980 [Paenibacillus baekrokdamisoli]